MTEGSKITLSAEELQLAANTQWILTKRSVIDKTCLLFGQLAQAMQKEVDRQGKTLPVAILNSTPKIAKGENYLQLPYVILDYPRCFTQPDIFAVRTMFWWGNFFSITLQVSGMYKNKLQQQLLDNSMQHQWGDFYICINEDEWQHHFEEDNYLPFKELSAVAIKKITADKSFIKVAVKYELQQWNEIRELLQINFMQFLHVAGD